MACTYNLYNLIGGAPDAGGSWSLFSGPQPNVSLNVDTVTDTYSTGATIGSTDAPILDFGEAIGSTLIVGTYVFEYSVVAGASCLDTSQVTIEVVPGVNTGDDITVVRCDSDNTAYNLMDFLSGGNGLGNGTVSIPADTANWSWTGSVMSPGYDEGSPTSPSDDTFNPSLVNPGQYTFTYTASVPDTSSACSNCEQSSTVTFDVSETADAGENNTITVCKLA